MRRMDVRLLIMLTIALHSCNIKEKGNNVIKKAEQKIKDKSDHLLDQLSPHFDAYAPDTKFNKQRFQDFLQVELTADVKNIYCFEDAIGQDASYQFSFHCDTTTFNKIIKKHQLMRDTVTTDFAFGIQNDFDWWNKEKIKTLNLYSWKGEGEYYKYFWYDFRENKAYYLDFDL